MNPKIVRLILLALVIGLIAIAYFFDLVSLFSFSNIKQQQDAIIQIYEQHAIAFPVVFFFSYVVMAAISFPGAAVMTLLAGALFGLVLGSVIVSLASTIGAALAFLFSRYVFRDNLQEKYSDKLRAINEGIEQEGAYYLLGLRLVPLFPFFVVNLLMGLTPIRLWTYYWVSQMGMLPATIIYVNAGTQLATLESASGILSPPVILAFVLLGIFPIIAKKLISLNKVRAENS